MSTHQGEERCLLAALGTAGMYLCLLWDTDLAEFNKSVSWLAALLKQQLGVRRALQETCFMSRGPAGELRTRLRSRGDVRQDLRDVSGALTGWP